MTKRYTKDHEWVSLDGDIATCGISAFAADKLGAVVYAELPEIGRTIAAEEAVAVVESAKAASDVYAPVSGEVVEANPAIIAEKWQTINDDPEGAGWFVKIRVANPSEIEALMDGAAYADFTKG